MVTAAERQHGILQQLGPSGRVAVAPLAEYFEVTSETIRRDLRILESRGELQRVHGGAIIPEALDHTLPRSPTLIPGFPPDAALLRLAEAATGLIEPGVRSIFLDSGLPCTALASLFGARVEKQEQRWTVVTTSLTAGIAFARSGGGGPGTGLVMIHGRVHAGSQSVTGAAAETMIHSLRADIAFLFADTVTAGRDIRTRHPDTVPVKRALIANAKVTVLLSPAEVFREPGGVSFADISGIDVLLTDAHPPPPDLSSLSTHNLQVVSP